MTKYLLQVAFAKGCNLEILRLKLERSGEDPGWNEQRLRWGESFYHHLRFASHTLKGCLVTHMKSEWIRRIIKCSMCLILLQSWSKLGTHAVIQCQHQSECDWHWHSLNWLQGIALPSTELSISKFPIPRDSPGQKEKPPAIQIQISFFLNIWPKPSSIFSKNGTYWNMPLSTNSWDFPGTPSFHTPT